MQKRDFVGLADTGAVCHCKRDLQRMKETLKRPTVHKRDLVGLADTGAVRHWHKAPAVRGVQVLSH